MWEALQRLGWSDARLGAEMRTDSGAVSRLLYGDKKANRQQAAKLLELLGTPLSAWDAPCPVKRRKHARPVRPPAQVEDAQLHARAAG